MTLGDPGLTKGEPAEDEGIGPIPTMAWNAIVPDRRQTPVTSRDSPVFKRRRRAVRDLGRAIRNVGEVSVVTEVDDDELHEARRLITRASEILDRRSRPTGVFPEIDDTYTGIRMYLPMSGEGNPVIDPIHFQVADDMVRGQVRLGQAYEGPPHHVHGGVSAMLLDQVLGYAVASQSHLALTRELTIRYRRPVPSEEPLWLCGRILSSETMTIMAEGWITTVAAPENRLVTTVGEFRRLRPEQVEQFIR